MPPGWFMAAQQNPEAKHALDAIVVEDCVHSYAREQCLDRGVYWERGLHPIVAEEPVVLELRRLDGTVVVKLIVNPQQLGGVITGFGAW